jgi:phosphoribosyl 1,2-cyclic phosphodiesterase
MIVRCYGARGSIPVSGEEFLKYGGDTTCMEIRTHNDEIIIVDAGSGIRRLGNKLLEEERFEYYMLFTHSHWDHILGFPFLKPIYLEETTLNVMGSPTTQDNLKVLLPRIMSAPHFPVPFHKLKARINYISISAESYFIDSVQLFSIDLSHPNFGLGYKFVENGKTFVFLTDNELGYRHRGGKDFKEYVEFSKNADLLIHDSEFTPEEYKTTRTWGHSTYADALELALEAGVKCFGLFHHNQDRNDSDQEVILEKCHEIIQSRKSDMDCFVLTQDTELTL